MFLGYACRGGYTLIDREIYLPRSWTDHPDRCAAAGVPDHVRFATKITLARRMLTRALEAGIPAAWATADEFYGGDQHLRQDLQARDVGYVLAVAKNHRVTTCAPLGPQRVDQVAAGLPPRCWNRRSAGEGSTGWRDYDWAWVRLVAPPAEADAGGHHYRLIRRNLCHGELAFYRCWSAGPVHLRTLVAVAGTRWSIETCFQTGKGLGLDEHQVRRWDSWYRHTTLVMLAHAILTVIADHERAHHRPDDEPLVPLTLNEIRRLFAKLVHQHRPHHRPLAGLVAMAPPTPGTRQDQPLPSPRPHRTSTGAYITNPGCRTSPCLDSRDRRVTARWKRDGSEMEAAPVILAVPRMGSVDGRLRRGSHG